MNYQMSMINIRAIHINHNFSLIPHMENYCVDACKEYDVELLSKIKQYIKSNIEDHLRDQRYKEIFAAMNEVKL